MKKLLTGLLATAAATAFADLKTALDAPGLEFSTGGDAKWFEQAFKSSKGDTALRSGKIADGGQSWIETKVSGSGMLSFNCGITYVINTEEDLGDGVLRLDIDGEEYGSYGETLWCGPYHTEKFFIYDEGEHTIRWTYTYEKDGESGEKSDCAWLDAVEWTPMPEEMTLTYETNGGDELDPETYCPGDCYEDLPEPSKYDEEKDVDYIFGGWYLDAELTKRVNKSEYIAFRDHTLYAKWHLPVEAANNEDAGFWIEGEAFAAVENAGADGGWLLSSFESGDYDDSELYVSLDNPGILSFKYRKSDGENGSRFHIGYEGVSGNYNFEKDRDLHGCADDWEKSEWTYPETGWQTKTITLFSEWLEFTYCWNVEFCDFEWTPISDGMTISFETNGGDELDPETYGPGTRYKDLPEPEKYDEENDIEYVFAGWYLDPELTKPAARRDYIALRDHTLYAKWAFPVWNMNEENEESETTIKFNGSGFESAKDGGADGGAVASTMGVFDYCYLSVYMEDASPCILEFKYRKTGNGDLECGMSYEGHSDDAIKDRRTDYCDEDYGFNDMLEPGTEWQTKTVMLVDDCIDFTVFKNGAAGLELCDFKLTPAPETMTVSFETDSDDVLDPETCWPGSMYCDFVEPSKYDEDNDIDYIFGGWYLDRELTRKAGGETYVPFRDHTLYAKWYLPVEAMSEEDGDGEEIFEFDGDGFVAVEGAGADDGWLAATSDDADCAELYFCAYTPGVLSFKYRSTGPEYMQFRVEHDGLEPETGTFECGWRAMSVSTVDGAIDFYIDEIDSGCKLEFCDFEWIPAPEEIVVSFDSNGGESFESMTFFPGDAYCDLPVPERDGFEFLGWHEDGIFGHMAIEDYSPVPFRDVTLVAKWANPEVTALPAGLKLAGMDGWRQITTPEGTIVESAFGGSGNYNSCAEEAYFLFESDKAGYFSFDGTCRPGWDGSKSTGWSEINVFLYDRDGEMVDAWYDKEDWQTQYFYIPGSGYTLEVWASGRPGVSSCVYCSDEGYDHELEPAYARLRNMSFEAAGPQEDFASWSGKLRFYKSWTAGDLKKFAAKYETRIAADSSDYEARILHAAAILGNLAENDVFKKYAKDFGVEFDYATLSFKGAFEYGAGSPDVNKMVDAAYAAAEPVFAAAMDDLAAIPADWTDSVELTPAKWPVDETVALDAADVMFMRSALYGAFAAMQFAASHDLTVDWAKIPAGEEMDRLRDALRDPAAREAAMLRIYEEQQAFLSSVRDPELLAASGDNLKLSLSEALAADAKALARSGDEAMHFFEYDPRFEDAISAARDATALMLASLDNPVEVDFGAIAENYASLGIGEYGSRCLAAFGTREVYLGTLFASGLSRDFMPGKMRLSDDGEIVPNLRLLKDPSLGGILPGITAEDWLDFATEAAPGREFDFDGSAVSFDANGGEEIEGEIAFCDGVLYGELPDAEREGHTFLGWTIGGAPAGEDAFFATTDIVAVAQWRVNQYTMSFDPADGSGVSSFKLDYGTALTAPRAEREGHTFLGWDPMPPATVPAEDASFTAKWRINSYSITFDTKGGSAIDAIVQEYGTPVAAPEDPVRDGYVFKGWDREIPATIPATGVAISALWGKIASIQSVDSSTGNAGMVKIPEGTVLVVGDPIGEENLSALEKSVAGSVSPRHGFSFAGFTDGADNPVTAGTTVWDGMSIVAEWDSFNPLSSDETNAVDGSSAQVFDGYILDGDGSTAGTIQVKVGKPNKNTRLASVSATVQMLGQKKLTFKAENGGKVGIDGEAAAEDVVLACAKAPYDLFLDYISEGGLSGSYGEYEIAGVRNRAKASAATYDAWKRSVSVAFKTASAAGSGAAFAEGYSTLTATVGAKGKTKVSGMMADGTKVNATVQLLPADGGEEACIAVVAPMYTGKTGGFAFNLWLDKNGGVAIECLSAWDATKGKTPFKAELETEAAGRAGAIGASATFNIAGGAEAWIAAGLPHVAGHTEYLPDGFVFGGGGKWSFAKADSIKYKDGVLTKTKDNGNPSGLKLSFKAKDGSFKGSFKAYAIENGKLKKYTANVTGAMIGGKGYGTAVIKKRGAIGVTVE